MGCCGGGFGLRRQTQRDTEPEPAEERDLNPDTVLKLRLARGEITVEQYRNLLEVLRSPDGVSVAANT